MPNLQNLDQQLLMIKFINKIRKIRKMFLIMGQQIQIHNKKIYLIKRTKRLVAKDLSVKIIQNLNNYLIISLIIKVEYINKIKMKKNKIIIKFRKIILKIMVIMNQRR